MRRGLLPRIFSYLWAVLLPLQAAPCNPEIVTQVPTPLSTIAGLPDSFVAGCVNVVTGDFSDSEVDMTVAGVEPLQVYRNYSSARSTAFVRDNSWRYNNNYFVWKGAGPTGKTQIRVPEGAGAIFGYDYNNNNYQNIHFDSEQYELGLTHCSGEVSARTNLKNSRITIDPQFKVCEVVLGSGARRRYSYEIFPRGKERPEALPLIFERKPNGNCICYDYDATAFNTTVRSTNSSQAMNFASFSTVEPNWSAQSAITQQVISGSDGRQVTYTYNLLPAVWHNKKQSMNQPPIYLLTHVARPDKPWMNYVYDQRTDHHGPRICQKALPEGRNLFIEYYESGFNQVGPDGIIVKDEPTLKNPKIDHRRGRVKLLKGPVGTTSDPLITHRFFYQITTGTDGKNKGGSTITYDALNCPKEYIFNAQQQLTCVAHYDQGSYQSIERLTWGAPKTALAGHLLEVGLYYPWGLSYSGHRYYYDSLGNIAQENFHGILSGYTPDHETYIKCYQYTQDDFHLLTQEEDSCSKKTFYSYHPGTDLLSGKYIFDQGKPCLREFYTYNDDKILVSKIVDNGTTGDPSDLTGVTERHLTVITLKREQPCYGYPEAIQEFAFDFATQQNVLQKKIIRSYSKEGWITSEELYDANLQFAGRKEWQYDNMGNITLEKNALGHTITRQYDINGNKILELGPNNQRHAYLYDYSNRLIREDMEVDGITLTTTHCYDLCSQLRTTYDPFGNYTCYGYDDLGRCNIIQDKTFSVTRKTFDLSNAVTSEKDPRGYLTYITNNVRGSPIEIIHPDGSHESFRYTLAGQKEQHITKQGLVESWAFDGLGRVIREHTSFAGAILTAVTHRYNGFHLLETIDPEGISTTYDYDFAGRLLQQTKGTTTISYRYDSLGRLTHTINEFIQVKEYDLLDRVIAERTEDLFGNIQRSVEYIFDEAGNTTDTITHTQAGPAITHTDYNQLNKPIRIIDALGNQTLISYNYSHINSQGQRVLQITTTDPLGNQTIITHDVASREVEALKKNPFGIIAKQEHTYDLAGNRIQTNETIFTPGKPERNLITTWEYGPGNRLEKVTQAHGEPLQKTTSYLYNKQGQKEFIVKPDGTTIEQRYNIFGLLSDLIAPNLHYQYTYDRNHLLLQVTDNNQTTTRHYDSQQRLIQETQATGHTLLYTYDTANRPTQITLPDQSTIHYTYEGINLKEVSRNNYTHRYLEYDLSGKLLSAQAIGIAGTLTFQHDLLGRLINLNTPCYQFGNTHFDPASNLLSYQATDPQGDVSGSYQYDSLYQLQDEQSFVSHHYQHDSLHNRIQKDDQSYQINSLNQIVDTTEWHYDYDLNGNLIRKTRNNQTIEYDYDPFDRLITVNNSIHYTYDPFNRRLTKEVDNTKITYLYDNQNDIGTLDHTNTLIELRILGIGRGAETGAAIAIELGTQLFAPIHNFRGDITALLNPATGTVEGSYRYSAFGEEQLLGTLSPWRFSSKRPDPHTALINFGRRDYDPTLGRWLEPDPSGFSDGMNLYAYVHNNPLTHFDLYGLRDTSSRYSPELDGRQGRNLRGPRRAPRKYLGATGAVASSSRSDIKRSDPSEKRSILEYFYTNKYRSQYGHLGKPELNPNVRITYTCGICTSTSESIAQAEKISGYIGGHNVHFLSNATHGFLPDGGEVFITKWGFSCHSVDALEFTLRCQLACVGREGTIVHPCFSQGAENTRAALERLGPLQKQVIVYNFGGSCVITDNICGKAINYYSMRDPVLLLAVPGMCDPRADVRFLTPQTDKIFDHAFDSPTYQREMEKMGREIQEKYGKQ